MLFPEKGSSLYHINPAIKYLNVVIPRKPAFRKTLDAGSDPASSLFLYRAEALLRKRGLLLTLII
jgi:hypothetical protein